MIAADGRRDGFRMAGRPLDHWRKACDSGRGALAGRGWKPQGLEARFDLEDVWGLEGAKRALELAAAGGHSLLFTGPGAIGKSLLAHCISGLLPPLTEAEAREVEEAHASMGIPAPAGRPLRVPRLEDLTPKRLASELHLAIHGVLVFDELPPLSPDALISLAELLRLTPSVQVVGTMRHCLCGRREDQPGGCLCSRRELRLHRSRRAAFLESDFQVVADVLPASRADLARTQNEPSAHVALRVSAARERQLARGALNALSTPVEGSGVYRLGQPGHRLLAVARSRLPLEEPDVVQLLRRSRTIADLAGREQISAADLGEAMVYVDRPVHGWQVE